MLKAFALPEVPVVYSVCNNIETRGIRVDLDFELRRLVEDVRRSTDLETLKRNPVISGYKSFLVKRVGVDPRVYPDILIRRVISGRTLPRYNPIMDIVNAVSLLTGIAMSPVDADRVVTPLSLIYLTTDNALRNFEGKEMRVRKGTVVLVDSLNRVIYVYPYKLTNIAPVTAETKRAVIIGYGAPSIPLILVVDSVKRVLGYFENFIRGVSCSQLEMGFPVPERWPNVERSR